MRIIIVFGLITLMCGCKKSFLELTPISQTSTEGFYKTAQDFNTAVSGAYAQLQNYPNMYFELSSYRSDELTLAAPTAGTQDRYNIDKFSDDPSNQLLLDVWKNLYNGIARCNEVITRLPAAAIPDQLKKQYDAETRLLRAYHYYNLTNFWGSVPLIDRPLTAQEALKAGKSGLAELNAFMEADLTVAIANLPAVFTGADIGRATSVAARTLMAKVQLRGKKYDAVKNTLQPLIVAGGTYDLLDDISKVFSISNKNNKEVIFSVRFNKDIAGEGHGLWLTTNSATATLVPDGIMNSYQLTDSRRSLLLFSRSGTSTTYVMNKFLDVLSTTTKNAENDFILLRFSDVLLMYAEALNELEQVPVTALDALNRVHQRAGLPAYKASELSSRVLFRDAVYLERKLEFPYEGQRYFDLVRTGVIQAEIKKYENITIPEYRFVYPLPQSEVEKINDASIFSQNTGYK